MRNINIVKVLKGLEIAAATAAVTTTIIDMVTTIESKCTRHVHHAKDDHKTFIDEYGVSHIVTYMNIENFPEYWEDIAGDSDLDEFIRHQAVVNIIAKSRATNNELNNMIEKENERFRQKIAEAADIQELIRLRNCYKHDAKKNETIETELKERVLKYIAENDVK